MAKKNQNQNQNRKPQVSTLEAVWKQAQSTIDSLPENQRVNKIKLLCFLKAVREANGGGGVNPGTPKFSSSEALEFLRQKMGLKSIASVRVSLAPVYKDAKMAGFQFPAWRSLFIVTRGGGSKVVIDSNMFE